MRAVLVKEVSGGGDFFGGYFGVPLFFGGDKYLLCHRHIPGTSTVECGRVQIDSDGVNGFTKLGHSHTWNFQQGALLQVVATEDRLAAYNSREKDRLVTSLIDCYSGERLGLLAGGHCDYFAGRLALGMDFANVGSLRPGYGYDGVANYFPKGAEGAALWITDIKANQTIDVYSLQQLSDLDFPNWSEFQHAITHPTFSPNGETLAYIHFYSNGSASGSRLMTISRVTGKCDVHLSGMASHYTWIAPDELVLWGGQRNLKLNANKGPERPALHAQWKRKLYRLLGRPRWVMNRLYGDSYYHVHLNKREISRIDALPKQDGHCTYSFQAKAFLTDTYPSGRANKMKLYLGGPSLADVKLAEVHKCPLRFENELRCDHHPRWSSSGKMFCADFGCQDGRRVRVYEVVQ